LKSNLIINLLYYYLQPSQSKFNFIVNSIRELKILLVSRKVRINPYISKGQVKALKLYIRLYKLDTTTIISI